MKSKSGFYTSVAAGCDDHQHAEQDDDDDGDLHAAPGLNGLRCAPVERAWRR
jgi:hypothetical protein